MSRGAPRWRPGSPRVSRMSPSTGSAHRRSARRSTWNTRSRPGTWVSVIACRVESMSRSGWVYMKGDAPFAPRGPVVLLRTMWAAQAARPIRRLARDSYINMIEAARNVADRYGFTREDGNDPDARSHSEQLIPLRRLSAPEEFSPVAAFVLSPLLPMYGSSAFGSFAIHLHSTDLRPIVSAVGISRCCAVVPVGGLAGQVGLS